MTPKNQKNAYRCANGHMFVTIDREEGTTPFMTLCLHCDQLAQSAFYPDWAQAWEPVAEWVKPRSVREVYRLMRHGHLMNRHTRRQIAKETWHEHVARGGLLLRKIPAEAKP